MPKCVRRESELQKSSSFEGLYELEYWSYAICFFEKSVKNAPGGTTSRGGEEGRGEVFVFGDMGSCENIHFQGIRAPPRGLAKKSIY